ncbi:MAG: LamG domain-containing protein [Candidatus Binatia bacterium]
MLPTVSDMKTTGTMCLAILSALILTVGSPASATTIDDKLSNRLAAYIVTPLPTGVDQKGDYAMAVLKLWDARTGPEQTAATTFVDQLCDAQNPLPVTGSNDVVTVWFQIPQLARMLLDPAMSSHLTGTNVTNIRRVLWQFINPRCKLTEANGTVWLTRYGENKSVIEKATCLMGSMALAPAGDGYDGTLTDGGTIAAHVTAWKGHFYEYFRQRGREGLMCEVADGYNGITGGIWAIVRDMMDPAIGNEPELQDLADKALDVFWADYATDFSPQTHIRAIAGSRYYKSSIDAVGADPLRSLTYAYEWHAQSTPPSPALSNWMVSGYRPPLVGAEDIIKNVATDDDRPSYLSTSRRLGRGVAGGTLQFGANHTSDVLRNLWVTRNYAIGGLTLRTDGTPYMDSGGASLDRVAGLVFSSDTQPGQRVVFYGSGDATGEDYDPANPQTWVGKREINSVSGESCLVAGRDPQSTHPFVKLFIASGEPDDNRDEKWGWIFTKTTGAHDDVFVAIRLCEGAYTEIPTNGSGGPSGNALLFADSTAPVVIEVATSAQYPGETGFEDFKEDCNWNWALHPTFFGHPAYDPATNKVDYQSLAGDHYEFWSNSATLPRKNGADINLNPTRTYDSPYVTGDHGRDFVTIGDGTNSAILDFNYTRAARRDDYQTLALWHMETITAGKVTDDDAEVAGRNRDLTLVNGPTLVTDTDSNSYRTAMFGKSLNLDGVNDSASAGSWPSLDNMVIDFWFKPDRDVGFNQTLVSASNVWEFRLEGTNIRFFTWDAASAVRSVTATGAGTKNVWHHIHAEVSNVAGTMTMTVDGVPQLPSSGANMKAGTGTIEVGFKTGSNPTRYFDGKIDDLKIRRWTDQ